MALPAAVRSSMEQLRRNLDALSTATRVTDDARQEVTALRTGTNRSPYQSLTHADNLLQAAETYRAGQRSVDEASTSVDAAVHHLDAQSREPSTDPATETLARAAADHGKDLLDALEQRVSAHAALHSAERALTDAIEGGHGNLDVLQQRVEAAAGRLGRVEQQVHTEERDFSAALTAAGCDTTHVEVDPPPLESQERGPHLVQASDSGTDPGHAAPAADHADQHAVHHSTSTPAAPHKDPKDAPDDKDKVEEPHKHETVHAKTDPSAKTEVTAADSADAAPSGRSTHDHLVPGMQPHGHDLTPREAVAANLAGVVLGPVAGALAAVAGDEISSHGLLDEAQRVDGDASGAVPGAAGADPFAADAPATMVSDLLEPASTSTEADPFSAGAPLPPQPQQPPLEPQPQSQNPPPPPADYSS